MKFCQVVGLQRCLPFLAGVLATVVSAAENWPQWRGPRADGTSSETGLPARWGAEDVLWRTPLPGQAGSTPIVWDDRIFLTSAKDTELVLLCLNTDGRVLWERRLGGGNEPVRGDEGNYASPSPSTDGRLVWATTSNGHLRCYDFDGNEQWAVELEERYGPFNIQFGLSSTPLLDGDRLYLQIMHQDAALVIALDKRTGSEVWRRERPSDAVAECLDSYASPFLYRDGQHEFLLTHGADYVVAHRLEDGEEIWRCGGFNPKGNYNPTLRLVASPVAVPGLIVVPSAKNRAVLGLRPDNRGNVTGRPEAHWWILEENTPDVPSPLVHDGLVYLCRENGVLLVLDARTGERVYMERCYPDRYRASPVYADGKVYVTSWGGRVTVVRAGREFERLAVNDLGEPIAASPVISNGRLYFRTYKSLLCVSGGSTAAKSSN